MFGRRTGGRGRSGTRHVRQGTRRRLRRAGLREREARHGGGECGPPPRRTHSTRRRSTSCSRDGTGDVARGGREAGGRRDPRPNATWQWPPRSGSGKATGLSRSVRTRGPYLRWRPCSRPAFLSARRCYVVVMFLRPTRPGGKEGCRSRHTADDGGSSGVRGGRRWGGQNGEPVDTSRSPASPTVLPGFLFAAARGRRDARSAVAVRASLRSRDHVVWLTWLRLSLHRRSICEPRLESFAAGGDGYDGSAQVRDST